MDTTEPKEASGASAADIEALLLDVSGTFKHFLETSPPDDDVRVIDRCTGQLRAANGEIVPSLTNKPDIQIHCGVCDGERWFATQNIHSLGRGLNYIYLTYECRNCQHYQKTFSVVVDGNERGGVVRKLGEYPPFGPPTPARLFKLIGQDYRELYLQGRRAENKSLGIGAYAYYRRIVEHQKGLIIGEIAKVANKLDAAPEILKAFEEAMTENQFGAAIDKIKSAIPETLLIDGHNPLVLLYKALSEGLHEQSDAECLELAHDIREVLTELADRVSTALKDKAELETSVNRLLSRRTT